MALCKGRRSALHPFAILIKLRETALQLKGMALRLRIVTMPMLQLRDKVLCIVMELVGVLMVARGEGSRTQLVVDRELGP